MPDFKFPPNTEVNKQVNRSWKRYVQNPALLKKISRLETPALFVYAENDIRPRWATEQLANLMPKARFEPVEGAEHLIWATHANELKSLVRNFLDEIKRQEKQ